MSGNDLMDNILLVDTDILIDLGRNDETAVKRINNESRKYKLAISSITQMELIVGCRNKTEMKILDKFLEGFEKISLSLDITHKAIELLKLYRLGHGLLIADSFIAATAIILNSPLLSKNQRELKNLNYKNIRHRMHDL